MRKHWGIFLLTAILAVPAGAASVYKWTDSEGKVHYGSVPPADRQAQQVAVDGKAPAQPVPAASSTGSEARAQPTVHSDAEEHCSVARHNLEILENDKITQFRDSEGTTVSYSSEERGQLIEEARAQIAYFCLD